MPLENSVLFGIPIPSANPLFLAGVAIHVLFGLAAIVAGACAMLLHKGHGRHSNFGIAYFWCLFGVFVTMSALAFSRWQEDFDLFILGALSFGAAWLGRTILQHRWQQWPRWHLTSMGASFILMITAFYVDNGKNLPLWRELPQIAFWFLPAMIGTPIILFVLRTHPSGNRDVVHVRGRNVGPTAPLKFYSMCGLRHCNARRRRCSWRSLPSPESSQ